MMIAEGRRSRVLITPRIDRVGTLRWPAGWKQRPLARTKAREEGGARSSFHRRDNRGGSRLPARRPHQEASRTVRRLGGRTRMAGGRLASDYPILGLGQGRRLRQRRPCSAPALQLRDTSATDSSRNSPRSTFSHFARNSSSRTNRTSRARPSPPTSSST